MWDTVQAFCSTVTGMLAAKAMLTGMGVGNDTASVGAALWQATVRRNIGKVARIAFVTFKGADLDDNAKSWRIVADVLNDLALAIELVSPALCPAVGDCNAEWAYFAAVSAAETFRAVVGVAGGATRAALTQHFALRDNFGDVNAKDGSQEVFVEILGSTVGMYIVHTCHTKTAAWIAFCILTCCHIAANVMACAAVELASFNRQRAHLVAKAWASQGLVLSPKSAAALEQVLYFGGSGVRGAQIVIGARLEQLLSCGAENLFSQLSSARQRPYVILVSGTVSPVRVFVGLRRGAAVRDILQAYIHAHLTAAAVTKREPLPDYNNLSRLVDKLEGHGWRLDSLHISLAGPLLEW